jgi:hypothetical protein
LTGFDFFTNTSKYGHLNTSVEQPSYTFSSSWLNDMGFDVSYLGTITENGDTSLTSNALENSISLGKDFSFLKILTFYLSYSHSFYSNNTAKYTSSFTDNVLVDLTMNYKNIFLGINNSFLFGKEEMFYTNFNAGYELAITPERWKNISFSVYPEVGTSLGDNQYYTYNSEFVINNFRELVDLYKNNEKFQNDVRYYFRVEDYPFRQALKKAYKENLNVKSKNGFMVTNINFSLPVYVNYNNLSLNLGVYGIYPMNISDYEEQELKLFYNAGISYIFAL